MQMIFHSHVNKTHFVKKGCALGLNLKVRVFGTRKWPVRLELAEKGVGVGVGRAAVGFFQTNYSKLLVIGLKKITKQYKHAK